MKERDAGPVLRMSGVTKAYGGLQALRGVTLDVESGDFLALIGPNGAGKTTLLNVLSGYERPSAGTVEFFGRDITGQRPHRIARQGLSRSFQVARVLDGLTAAENIQASYRASGSRPFPREAASKGKVGPRWSRASKGDLEESARLLRVSHLEAAAQVSAGRLSNGDRKRLEVAMIIAQKPKALVLDEPMAGLAPDDRTRMMDWLVDAAKAEKWTVLFTEHDMDVVFSYATRVAVLHQGAVLIAADPATVAKDDRVQEAYLGH